MSTPNDDDTPDPSVGDEPTLVDLTVALDAGALEGVRQALTVEPLDEVTRLRLRRTALEAAGAAPAGPADNEPGSRRSGRSARTRRITRWIAPVAAAAAVAVAFTIAGTDDRPSQDQPVAQAAPPAATGAADEAQIKAQPEAAAVPESMSQSDANGAEDSRSTGDAEGSAPARPDLGALDTATLDDAVRNAMVAASDGSAGQATVTTGADRTAYRAIPCGPPADRALTVLLIADATFDGEPAVVVVRADEASAPGDYRVTVRALDDCRVLASRALVAAP